MSYTRRTNKRPVETFLVANASDNLYNVAGSGDNITNGTTKAVVLADGQLGIFAYDGIGGSVAANVATDATPTITEAPTVYIAQGTADSANPSANSTYPLSTRAYETSGPIRGTNPIRIVKTPYLADTHSIWQIGEAAGTTGEIVAYDDTEYQMRIAFRGRRADEINSPEGTATVNVSFTSPNYTALSTAQPRDHVIQNICWQINRNSKALNFDYTRFRGNAPVVAFAIDTTGAAGDNIGGKGTGATLIAAGDAVPVINTDLGVRTLTLTSAMAESIKSAAVAASGDTIANTTWSILTIDLSTAGTATGGVADAILIMALDDELAYEDRIPQVKNSLDIGLTSGFDFATVTHDEVVYASEGSGSGRVWDRWYRNTHGQRKYSLDHTMDPVIEYASPVSTSATYASYVINHESVNQIDTSNLSSSPQRCIILVPSANTTLITALDTAFNAYLASANAGAVITL